MPTGMIRYDNLKPAVIRIALGGERFQHPRFVAMRSHYGELSRRVCLKPFIRDGRTAADRATVAAVVNPLKSPIERGDPMPAATASSTPCCAVAAPDKPHHVRPHDHLSGPYRDRPAAAAPAYAPLPPTIEPAPVPSRSPPLLLTAGLGGRQRREESSPINHHPVDFAGRDALPRAVDRLDVEGQTVSRDARLADEPLDICGTTAGRVRRVSGQSLLPPRHASLGEVVPYGASRGHHRQPAVARPILARQNPIATGLRASTARS